MCVETQTDRLTIGKAGELALNANHLHTQNPPGFWRFLLHPLKPKQHSLPSFHRHFVFPASRERAPSQTLTMALCTCPSCTTIPPSTTLSPYPSSLEGNTNKWTHSSFPHGSLLPGIRQCDLLVPRGQFCR